MLGLCKIGQLLTLQRITIGNTMGSKVYGMRVCIKILSREDEGESGVEEKSNETCKLTTSTRYLSRTRRNRSADDS